MKICDVCGMNFRIEYIEPNNLGSDKIGLSQFSKGLITIDKTMPENMQECTLVHEWLHMILDSNGFISESDDEKLVSVLQSELYRAGFRVPVKDIEEADKERSK
jgi:hypothetical protein